MHFAFLNPILPTVLHTNSVMISQCSFTGNLATKQGGGGISIGYIIYPTDGEALYNTYSSYISLCFKQNQALRNLGDVFLVRSPAELNPQFILKFLTLHLKAM